MLDSQTIQILNTIGTWIAGIGTLVASAVALLLARRVEKVKLNAKVGVSYLVEGVRNPEECVVFRVIKFGERPVTIDSIEWCIGRGKQRKYAFQTLSRSSEDQIPKKLAYRVKALFVIKFSESLGWMKQFAKEFVSNESVKTLRALIHTTVNHTESVKPQESLFSRIQDERTCST